MCGKSMNMIKVCGNILSKVTLGKNWGTRVYKRAIYYKNLIFREIWKIPCVVQNLPCVVPVWKTIDNQIPCFPCAMATLHMCESPLQINSNLYLVLRLLAGLGKHNICSSQLPAWQLWWNLTVSDCNVTDE